MASHAFCWEKRQLCLHIIFAVVLKQRLKVSGYYFNLYRLIFKNNIIIHYIQLNEEWICHTYKHVGDSFLKLHNNL